MKHINKLVLVALAATMFNCSEDFEHPVEDIKITSGDADFSKYIALGNSLTSGYRDNALYKSGQENSYPNILAGQMKAAGGGEFKIPYMPNDVGGFNNADFGGLFPGKLELKIVNGALTPVPSAPGAALDNVATAGPYQNMGVPGAKSYHLIAPGYGNPAGLKTIPATANPYFVRFSNNPATSVVAQAVAQAPTFYSLWIGNNDVLGYATSGGVGVDHNETGSLDAAKYESGDISNVNVVKTSIATIVGAMKQGGAKGGVIANIPSVTAIPYFTTVPYAPLSPTNASFGPMIDQLNSTFAGLNKVFDALGAPERKIVFSKTAASAVVIKDKDLPDLSTAITTALIKGGQDAKTAGLFGLIYGQARQATSKDLLVLTSSSVIGKVDTDRVKELMSMGVSQADAGQLAISGITYPLVDKYVLTAKETAKAEAAVTKFNAAIAEVANANGLALVDAYSEMKKLSSASGIKYYGQTYTTTFVSGGAFSLDGVHLTGNGYAIVANMFIDAINRKYHSTLRNVYPGGYPGIAIP